MFVGGVIPPQDYDCLYQAGVTGVFGPGTVIPDLRAEDPARADREHACRARLGHSTPP